MGHLDTSNFVHIYVDLSQKGNNELFERSPVHELLKPIIGKVLRRYGLHYNIMELGGMGGGGGTGPTAWEIIKQFIEYKELVGLAVYLLNSLKSVIAGAIGLVASYSSPKIYLSFKLEDESVYETPDIKSLSAQFSSKLLNLNQVMEVVIKEIMEELPLFDIEKVLRFSFTSLDYHITYTQGSCKSSSWNKSRLVILIKGLKVLPETDTTYELRRFLIRRTDGLKKFARKKQTQYITKKYFMLFSSRIFGE